MRKYLKIIAAISIEVKTALTKAILPKKMKVSVSVLILTIYLKTLGHNESLVANNSKLAPPLKQKAQTSLTGLRFHSWKPLLAPIAVYR